MGYFDPRNGWLQFVFGNKNDNYFLPSLIRVGFQGYLLHCLKKAGYETIYFWDESREGDGKYELSVIDEISAQHYAAIQPKKKKFLRFISGSSGTAPAEMVWDENKWNPVRLMPVLMEELFYNVLTGRDAKKSALVAPISVFEHFFSDRAKRAKLLKQERNLKTSGNLLLLTASVQAEDSNLYFTKQEGTLFQLLKEVSQAARPDGSWRHFYARLSDYMGEGCVYFNELSLEIIRSIVRKNVLLSGKGMIPADGEMMDKIALTVEWYYHSPALRTAAAIQLPENPRREYAEIDRSLQNQWNCDTILNWLKQTAENMSLHEYSRWLSEYYPREDSGCHIYTDSFLLKKWNQLAQSASLDTVHNSPELHGQMAQCQKLLEYLAFRGGELPKQDALNDCIHQLDKSLRQKDMTTFGYALDGMEYLLNSSCKALEEKMYAGERENDSDISAKQQKTGEDIWTFYKKIFELSEAVLEIDQDLKNYRQTAEARSKQMHLLFRQIDEMGRTEQEKAQENGEYGILQQQAVRCDDDIQFMNTLSKLKRNRQFQYQQSIDSIRRAIKEKTGGGQVDVQMILEQAISLQNLVLENSIDDMKRAQEMTQRDPDALARITGQSFADSEDLEERYQALARKMDRIMQKP